jgi:prepilin-type N-terminal cleavage/methylation domain-containing protein
MRPVTGGPRGRRGFTLIELLLSMLLLGIVTAGIYRVLVSNQRTYHAQTQRIRLQQNIRAAGNIIPAELREVAASDNDIYLIGASEIRMRAMRQFGVMCLEPVLGVGLADLPITLFQSLASGPALAAGDSLLLYYEGDEGSRLDDQWWRAQIRSVVGNALCPDGISQGTMYRINLAPATARFRAAGRCADSRPSATLSFSRRRTTSGISDSRCRSAARSSPSSARYRGAPASRCSISTATASRRRYPTVCPSSRSGCGDARRRRFPVPAAGV